MPRKKKTKNQQSPSPSQPNSCKSCQKSHLKLSKCSRCKEVYYCSIDCQKKDWVNHEGTCKLKTSAPQAPDPSLPNNNESCNNCGKSGVKLSVCSRCKRAKYCSKECQKAEWSKHKVDCKKESDLSSGASNTFNQKCLNCSNICVGLSEYCEMCNLANYFNKLRSPVKVPEEVYMIAKSRYPGFQLITTFRDANSEDAFISRKQVLVALMYQERPHPFRPSMILRDERQELFQLIFYLDTREQMKPHNWEKFKAGNYICILYPEIHFFLDFTVGFRIESTSLVSYIKAPSSL